MKILHIKKFFALFTLLLLLVSCRKDPSWESEYIFPLFQDKLTLHNFFADTSIKADTDQTAILVLDQDIITIMTDTFVDLPDSLYYFKYVLPFGVEVPPNTLVFTKTESKYFNLGGPELTQVKLKSGFLYIKAYNYVHDNAYIEYTIENSNLNGAPLKFSGILPSYPLTGKCLIDSIPVDGVFLDLTPSSHHNNSIRSTIKIYANPYADTNVVVNFNDSIMIVVEFRKTVIDYARGYFGSTNLEVEKNNSFSAIKDLGTDYLDLDKITMQLSISNYIGADAIFSIDEFTGTGKQTLSLQSSYIGKNIYMARAREVTPFTGQVIPTRVDLDLTNSNIEEFIENLPYQLRVRMKAKINPFGNISSGNDFVYYGSGLNFHMHAEIPLRIAFSNLTLRDTMNYDFPHTSIIDIREAQFLIHYENSFPIDAQLTLFVLDKNNTVLDSILVSQPIQGGFLDNVTGKVIQPRKGILKIDLTFPKVATLKQGKKIMVKAQFSTNNRQQKVRITPESYLLLNIKTNIKTSIE